MAKATATGALERSWLVQRLRISRTTSPFSFGGGLRNGGLSEEAMRLLSQCFGFDYMGAAEFEFGAVPTALRGMASARLTAGSFEIDLSTVPGDWRLPKDAPTPAGTATVYYLCRRGQEDGVRERVVAWATGSEDLKERTRLSSSLRPHHEWDTEIGGWLELNNGFFFFTDQSMWRRTADVFGVKA